MFDYPHNTTIIPRLHPGQTECFGDSEFESFFQYTVGGCSILIIILFSVLEKGNAERPCQCTGGRPGLIYPVNLLDDTGGRFGYAAAFGSTTSAIWNLFTNPESYFTGAPSWSKTLVIMASVLYIGILYYPLFACLTTAWIFLGSAIGLFYSGAWFLYSIREVVKCPDGKYDDGLPYQGVAQQLPVLVCLFILIVIYAHKFLRHTISAIKNANTRLMAKNERKAFAAEYHREYVRQLITPAYRCQIQHYEEMATVGDRTRRLKFFVSKWIYKGDPTFKFSTKVICVLTVSLICAYEFGIILVLALNEVQTLLPLLYPAVNINSTLDNSTDTYNGLYQVRVVLRVFSISTIISFVLSSFLTLYSIFQILVNYRNNLKMMFKGDYQHFPFNRGDRRSAFIMSDSLAYAGSQVGYILWGYIIMFLVLLILCFLIAYLIVLPLIGTVSKQLLLVLVNAIPPIAIYQGLIIIQQLSSGILLQSCPTINENGKETKKSVLAVDNRKIYHNMSYFLFFFYIVLGVFGCFVTILKGIVLGVFYLARLDRCGLFQGFEKWDRGYMYYLSFLYVEESHRHPVLLVFCDTLYEYAHRHDHVKLKRYGATDEESSNGGTDIPNSFTKQPSMSPERKLLRNKWLKAYTMVRNSCLVKPKEDGDTSCDSDDILIDLDRERVDSEPSATLLEC